jgi:PEP-CTERM motif
MKIVRATALCALLLVATSALTFASVIATFNFDSDTVGTSTPFTDTNNGVMAQFEGSEDPGTFFVTNASAFPFITFHSLTGNYLVSSNGNGDSLFVVFSTVGYSVSFNFALSAPGTATAIVGYFPGGITGGNSAGGVVPAGYRYPEGFLQAGSPLGLNAIEIYSSAPDMAIDNLTLATPEPASLLMLGSGLLGLAGLARRRLLG